MIIKAREIDSGLTRKGFVKEKRRKHTFYFLFIEGKKTQIRTKLSHGSKEYNDELLSYMRKQLKFDSIKELKNFIECPISGDEYVRILMDKSIIY